MLSQAEVDGVIERHGGGDPVGALADVAQLLALHPRQAVLHNLEAAIFSAQGESERAKASIRKALELAPNKPEFHNNLGSLHKKLNDVAAAIACYEQALQLKPDYVEVHNNLGDAFKSQGKLLAAVESFERALALRPDYPLVLTNLGGTQLDRGELDAALAAYQRAWELASDDPLADSRIIFTGCYRDTVPAQTLTKATTEFGAARKQLCADFAVARTQFGPSRQRGLQRVGFLSPDWKDHPIGQFMLGLNQCLQPLLQAQGIELVLYSSLKVADQDDITTVFQATGARWREVAALSDAELAQTIRDDGIDVLFDLSGHGHGHRLNVFAARSAPVQVSWLGYCGTTGLPDMDYVLGDDRVIPSGDEAHFSESVWRLPGSYLCFTPPVLDVAVSSLPALDKGYVTFGCFNNLIKMTDAVVALWSQVLLAVPESRLFLHSWQLGSPEMIRQTFERFIACGVNPEHITLQSRSPREDFLRAYQGIDIALDPFPYQGVTTTCEALWMGVPVLSLRGDRMVARNADSIASAVGLEGWVANSREEYLAKAVQFAGDLESLALLRAGLRQQLVNSSLCDAPQFANDLAQAMQGMWDEWRQT